MWWLDLSKIEHKFFSYKHLEGLSGELQQQIDRHKGIFRMKLSSCQPEKYFWHTKIFICLGLICIFTHLSYSLKKKRKEEKTTILLANYFLETIIPSSALSLFLFGLVISHWLCLLSKALFLFLKKKNSLFFR